MDDLSAYWSVFVDEKKFPYTKERIAKISRNRVLLDNLLFFDVLLTEIAHIDDPSRLYPPKNTTALRHMYFTIEQIDDTKLDRLKKNSFYYYVLKDFDRAWNGCNFAEQYARMNLIPMSFCNLIDGVYALDNLEFEDALRHLTDPSVTPFAPHKIMSTFLTQAGSTLGPVLVSTFVQVTQPVLDTDASIRTYFTALKLTCIENAFTYQRTVPVHLQEELFTKLIDYCLTNKPQMNALKLVNFPFNPEEQAMFDKYIKKSSISIAQDTAMIRQIHQGQYNYVLNSAHSAQHQDEAQLQGVNWADLARGLALGIGPRGGIIEERE
ncbi:hypothetical protein RUND412_009779 [Rhizina undulata]